MATIIEGAIWTLTEAAAERMVENGLITRCDGEHVVKHLVDDNLEDLLEVDKPIYHRARNAPDWFGFATISGAIRSAEEHVDAGMKEELKS